MPRLTSSWVPSGEMSQRRASIWPNWPVLKTLALTVGRPSIVNPCLTGRETEPVLASAVTGIVLQASLVPKTGSKALATAALPPAEVNSWMSSEREAEVAAAQRLPALRLVGPPSGAASGQVWVKAVTAPGFGLPFLAPSRLAAKNLAAWLLK